MEYTESLQAPPSTYEAWPTKPRSVSHWPGLAGPKACRLSAGRPSRLRTLTTTRFATAMLRRREIEVKICYFQPDGRSQVISASSLFAPIGNETALDRKGCSSIYRCLNPANYVWNPWSLSTVPLQKPPSNRLG